MHPHAHTTLTGAGVGTCYRGSRLYDTPGVQEMVQKWTQFWVRHRRILTEDILHVRRPSVSGIDALCHVSSVLQHPDDEEPMLCLVYNPSPRAVHETLHISLYYTGLREGARVVVEEGDDAARRQTVALGRGSAVSLQIDLAPESITWFTFTATN